MMQLSCAESRSYDITGATRSKCIYNGVIYMINVINKYTYSIIEHKKYMKSKEIYKLTLPQCICADICFKNNSDRPPEIILFIQNDPPYVNVEIHDMFSGKKQTKKINCPISVLPYSYEGLDNIAIIWIYDTGRFICNIDSGEVIEYHEEIDLIHANILDKKIYLLLEKKNKKIKLVSIDSITGHINDVHTFTSEAHVKAMDRMECPIYLIDNIFYFADNSYNIIKCFDIKTDRYFTIRSDLNPCGVIDFNTKRSKLYSLTYPNLLEYNILTSTLFKSKEVSAYRDISIITQDDE